MRPRDLFTITVGSSLRPGRAFWAAACPATLRWRRFRVSASACAEVMLEVLLALLSVLPEGQCVPGSWQHHARAIYLSLGMDFDCTAHHLVRPACQAVPGPNILRRHIWP